MKVLSVRNGHEALAAGVNLLRSCGQYRTSRNGEVVLAPGPVTTVYSCPIERVIFWPERDANPFFHLYEALWMLSGRDDLAPLLSYVKQMREYSDDGVTLHGAYGKRWRAHFGLDQLSRIAWRLRHNPDDRRSVLQMWDAANDLDRARWGKDVPCNLTATLQRDIAGRLDMVVFCRSNDIVWGAYGANLVHFSMMQEYVACLIGCEVGTYTQVSVNYHAYTKTIANLWDLSLRDPNPYEHLVRPTPMKDELHLSIHSLCREAIYGPHSDQPVPRGAEVFRATLDAHRRYRVGDPIDDIVSSLRTHEKADWCRASIEWLERRRKYHFQETRSTL